MDASRGSYQVTVRASDSSGLHNDSTFTIAVTKAVADGTVTFASGIVRIGGTSANDTLLVSRNQSGTAPPTLLVSLNGKTISNSINLANITQIQVWTRGGNDSMSNVQELMRRVNRGVDMEPTVSGGLDECAQPGLREYVFQLKCCGNRVVEICSGLRIQVDPELVRVVGILDT